MRWTRGGPISNYLETSTRYFVEHRKLDVRSLDLEHCMRWHAGRETATSPRTRARTAVTFRDFFAMEFSLAGFRGYLSNILAAVWESFY